MEGHEEGVSGVRKIPAIGTPVLWHQTSICNAKSHFATHLCTINFEHFHDNLLWNACSLSMVERPFAVIGSKFYLAQVKYHERGGALYLPIEPKQSQRETLFDIN